MVVTKKGKAVKKVKVKLTEQSPPKIKKIVNLRCQQGPSDIAKRLIILNNTDQAVPKGRTIHWKTDGGDKGSRTLQNPLAPGETIEIPLPGSLSSFSCTSWYFGPPPKIGTKGKLKAVE